MDAMTGRTVGNYRIVERLGEGGMGKVYRALDTMVEREVALKCLRPEIAAQPGILERFRREAVVLARLNHPAIAQLYTFFKEGEEFYMVMEYVAGETLERAILRHGPLPWPEALSYGVQILEGIGHAHALGILHRDLKPANVILTPAGKVKLTDFGIAQALGAARLTREGRVVGTLEYLSPERIQGKPADARSDLYSTGVILFEMLTARLPFESESEYELLLAQVQKQPPTPRTLGIDLPGPVEAAVMTAMEKKPEDRYPDAASFAAALSAVIPAETESRVELKPTRLVAATPSRFQRWFPRKRRFALAGACAGLAMALVAVGLWRSNSGAPAPAPVTPSAQTALPPPDLFAPPPQPATPLPPPTAIRLNPVEFAPAPKAQTAQPKESMTPAVARSEPQNIPAPKPAPALTAEVRRSAVVALEQTDGPAAVEPGSGPIRLTGLLAALRIGGQAITGEIVGPIASRGVDFSLTAANEAALREAGATPELLRLITISYQVPKSAEPAARAQAAERRIRSISDIRSIYVDPAPQGLDGHIREELRKQLGGTLRVTESAGTADATMHVTVESPRGGMVSGAARMLRIKDRSVIRAVILERQSAQVLWQQGAGDRKPIVGAFRGESLQGMAERIVRELRQDLVSGQPQ